MKRIGILSDTHGYFHPDLFEFFSGCDEIWHAGDIGDSDILTVLRTIAPVRAVWGNCDGWDVRGETAGSLVFNCEGHKVAIKHIVGKPGYYEPEAMEIIKTSKPTIFVAGHSHILRVMQDPTNKLLFINPGAAGRYGIHTRLTFLRLKIDGTNLSDLEVYDEPKQVKIP